ncbi:unnamed protein product [Chrysoparadoxa australica]
MDLGALWKWEKKKLPCKIREESGNPAVDDLRERVADLAGVNLGDVYEEGLTKKVGRDEPSTKWTHSKAPAADGDITPRPKLPRDTQRTLASAKQVLSVAESGQAHINRNLNKMYTPVPRALPAKLMMDVQRERVALLLGASTTCPGSGGEEEIDDEATQASSTAMAGWKNTVAHDVLNEADTARHSALTAVYESFSLSAAPAISSPSLPQFSLSVRLPLDLTPLLSLHLGRVLQDKHDRLSAATPEVFKANYKGDIFGTGGNYMGGMVYMSRMPVANGMVGKMRSIRKSRADGSPAAWGMDGSEDQITAEGSALDGEAEEGVGKVAPTNRPPFDPPAHSVQVSSQRDLDAKRQCAAMLLQWSLHKENAQRLVKEGSVEAILKMTKVDDLSVRAHCSAVLKHFGAAPILAERLVVRGGVAAITELASQARKPLVQRNCMVALANLTSLRGYEERMVEDGIVLALQMLVNEQENFAELCAQALFNLTCVSEPYNHIERVIKCLLATSSNGNAPKEVKHISASALCNLADLPAMHSRLIEEGAISTLASIARGAQSRTRRLCAVILNSLASNKHERTNMVNKGVVPVLYGLSSDEDLATLNLVSSTMLSLGGEEQSHSRMMQEGAASALCNIAMICASDPRSSLPCSIILYHLSCHDKHRLLIAQEGVIPAMVTLLQTSTHEATLYHSLLTICRILTLEDNHLPILKQGGFPSILALCDHESRDIQAACSLALFSFSCGNSNVQEMVVAGGGTRAVISLIKRAGSDLDTRRRCAAVLCNLARASANVPPMVAEGVIPSIIDLLKTGDILAVKYCCAALCLVAQDINNCPLIVSEGAVSHMLIGAKDGDQVTKQSCCAVLSALSGQKDCREQLCASGALPALIQLAQMDDSETKLRCVIAFANLSCEVTIQSQMVEAAVVRVLAELSNSYKEETQLYCARALCNLACHHGSEMALIEQGGVTAIMMIAMVRSVSLETKQICARSLLNLMAEGTVELLLEEGLVAATTNLSKLDDEPSMRACATVFTALTGTPLGRKHLMQRKSSLLALFDLLRSGDQATKCIVGKGVCNIVCCPDSQRDAVEAGSVAALKKLAKLGVPDVEVAVAQTLFIMCHSDHCREELCKGALSTIIFLACSLNREARWLCVRAICLLAWYPDSRGALTAMDFALALVNIADAHKAASQLEDDHTILQVCTRALYYLSSEPTYIGSVIDAGAVRALCKVVELDKSAGGLALAAASLQCIIDGCDSVCLSQIANEGGVELVCEIINNTDTKVSSLRLFVSSKGVERGSTCCESTLHCCTVIVYRLTCGTAELKQQLVLAGVTSHLSKMSENGGSKELILAILTLLSNDPENRARVVKDGGAALAVAAVGGREGWQAVPTALATNACCVIFLLSQTCASVREALRVEETVQLMSNMSKSGHDVLKKMAGEGLNNLTSNTEAGIEEGTVSAIISRSMEGGTDLDDESNDVLSSIYQAPAVSPLEISAYPPTEELSAEAAMDEYCVAEVVYIKTVSGGGGSQPPPPQPPRADGEDGHPLLEGLRALDPEEGKAVKGDVEGEKAAEEVQGAKFTKMDTPESYNNSNDAEEITELLATKPKPQATLEDISVSQEVVPAAQAPGTAPQGGGEFRPKLGRGQSSPSLHLPAAPDLGGSRERASSKIGEKRLGKTGKGRAPNTAAAATRAGVEGTERGKIGQQAAAMGLYA